MGNKNIIIGTAQFGMDYGIANSIGRPPSIEIENIMDTAIKNDIWFYDTAKSYGYSEKALGIVFSKMNINDKVKCITKLDPNFTFQSFNSLKKTVQKSLNHLNINYLWGLLLHRPKIYGNWNQFLKSIEHLKNVKLIKNFGVSVYTPEEAIRFAVNKYIDVIQVPFNAMDRRLIDNNFFEVARENNKKVFIRSIFLQGLLLMDEKQIIKKKMGWTLEYIRFLIDFVESQELNLQSFLLNSVLMKIPDVNLIIGIDSMNQLKENLCFINNSSFNEVHIYKSWWEGLPQYPEKFLNPSLWPKTQ